MPETQKCNREIARSRKPDRGMPASATTTDAQRDEHTAMRYAIVLLLSVLGGSPVLGLVAMPTFGPRSANSASLSSPVTPSAAAGLSMCSVHNQEPPAKSPTPTTPLYPATLLVATVLAVSLLAPVQATAMGGGGASSGGGFSGGSSFSMPPAIYYSPPPAIYYSPPPSTLYIFPPSPPSRPSPPPRPRTRAEIAADEKDFEDRLNAVGKTAALGGAGFLGYSALRSKTQAKKPVGGLSQETILVDRRASVNSWTSSFASKELEVRPPNGAWAGTYKESGNVAAIRYNLKFDSKEGVFSGSGSDVDGSFVIENGVFSPTTGRFEWTQRTKPGSPFPCVTNCVASASNVEADGIYGRPSSLDGNYATDQGYKGPFSISPVA